MAGGLGSFMGLIGEAWSGRLDMLRWLTDETLTACADAAELGVADGALGYLPWHAKNTPLSLFCKSSNSARPDVLAHS